VDLVEQFINQYVKEIDYYDNACRISTQQLQHRFHESGIRAIVTSRAKTPERLEPKLRKRQLEKKYSSICEIYEDIVDLAGVRVALYFPAESAEVDKIIKNQFKLLKDPKVFSGSKPSAGGYTKKFSGYLATHYHVSINPDSVSDQEKRYCDALRKLGDWPIVFHHHNYLK
jgi:ppGpp synthetase/RelA/SpoT-type nucleotidyltranferase